jgi:hypothetical protein
MSRGKRGIARRRRSPLVTVSALAALLAALAIASPAAGQVANTWSGTWVNSAPDGSFWVFSQSGSSVGGVWKGSASSGTLSGTISGGTLTGTLVNNEAGQSASFSITLAADGRSFSGTFTITGGSTGQWRSACTGGGCLSNTAPPPPPPPPPAEPPPVAPPSQPAPPVTPPNTCSRALIAGICDVTGASPFFGTDLELPAPTRGTAIATKFPVIPSRTKTVTGEARLAGAAPGPVGGVVALTSPKLTGRNTWDDVFLCAFFALSALEKPTGKPKFDAKTRETIQLRVLIACAQWMDPVVDESDGATQSATGCRARFVALPVPGKRPPARRLSQAEAKAKALLRGSCSGNSSGRLKFTLTAKQPKQGIRELIGSRAVTGFARTAAPKNTTQSADPKLVVKWSRAGSAAPTNNAQLLFGSRVSR